MSLHHDAPEYVPSFRQRSAPVKAATTTTTAAFPPPPPAAAQPSTSKISVTRTTVNTTSPLPSMSAGIPPQPPLYYYHGSSNHNGANHPAASHLPPSPAMHASSTRSPAVLARSVPTRMSPIIVPRHHMNPNAVEFIPGSSGGPSVGAGGLEALPTSTADMERGQSHTAGADAVAASSRTPPSKPASIHRVSAKASPIMAPKRLETKTEAEINEISKRSALKVDAAAYVPQRTLTRVVLVKPSPMTLAPSEDPVADNVEMMLNDVWSLFYLPSTWGESIKEEDYDPILVFRIDSIPTFWKVFNNITVPSSMGLSTVYLFRDGINPKWEDAANCDGGVVKVKATTAQIDEAWELLLCRTIGDSWSAPVRPTINGVVLKVRERAYMLEVWVTKQTPELMRDLAELWQPVLGGSFAAPYITHAMVQERSQAAAVAAEKQKKQKKRF